MTRIVGVLEAFADQGSEGIHWAIVNNNKAGLDALMLLQSGDYLFVEDGDHGIEWEGTVTLKDDINLEPYPFNNNGHFWQRVNHCTVHGLQEEVEPNVWFEWFVTNRPAVLIRHSNGEI